LLETLSVRKIGCRPAAVVIEPVSAHILPKTGIFAEKAGDFRRFPSQPRQSGSPETKANARKAGISGPFSRLLGSLAERRSAWLTWEDSNFDIPISKNAFEMSAEFPLFWPKTRLGDFCSCKLWK